MEILLHPADKFGCGNYRLLNPAATIHSDTLNFSQSFHYLTDDELEKHKIQRLITQRQTELNQIVEMKRYKSRGIYIVNDLDDLLWNVPPSNSYRQTFKNDNRRALIESFHVADHNVVSTEPLQDEIKKAFGVDTVVLPNMLLPQYYANGIRERFGGKLKAMWAGSSTHYGDLSILRSVIAETSDVVDWTFFGYCPDEFKQKVTFVEGVDFPFYHNKILTTPYDLAVVPLENNRFNTCKSNLKLLEFGACGVPVVTSDIYPYKDNPGIRIQHGKKEWKQWTEAIRTYATNETLRKEDAIKTYEYAKTFLSTLEENMTKIKKGWSL